VPERSREVTLTLPANRGEAFKVLADRSGYVVNRLFQPIRNKYGDECHWFFVWEYQKRGALHMHVCIFHKDVEICEVIADKLINQWHQILCDVSEVTGICMFTDRTGKACTIRQNHQNHTAPIQKTVGAYFSKYAGKSESKQFWYCQKYPVSRFWGSSKAVKAIIKANSLKYDYDLENEKNANLWLESIIEKIITKLAIVSANLYDFDIQLSGQTRINTKKNGGKEIITDPDRSVANGTRYTFYFDSNQFEYAMNLIQLEMSAYS
jgi:hypothetical protein